MTNDFFLHLRHDPDAAAPPESVREERRQDKSSRFIAIIDNAETAPEKVSASAEWILTEFDAYYLQSRRIPGLAQHAFESRDAALSVELSHQRLSLYGMSVANLAADLRRVFPEVASDQSLWASIETQILPMIEGRYEADLAFAFFHSVRRIVYRGEWTPVDYSFRDSDPVLGSHTFKVHRSFVTEAPIEPELFARILDMPGFRCPYRDRDGDAAMLAERINAMLAREQSRADTVRSIEVINAGFFRNRGGYIVGRIARRKRTPIPLIIALLNSDEGLFVDAVLTNEADAHNIFSSTLANFHVTNTRYHELSGFLHEIMPKRPIGLHYSTIGFNHVGKVAVMSELKGEITLKRVVLEPAVGFPGTVAIGFATPSSAYNLKVIRNHPTAGYKWDEFEGVASVLDKYKRVHEINRTGSMLDSIIYQNLQLDPAWFAPALLDELLEQASDSVSLHNRVVVMKHLIVQRRMTPLPVFLENASPEDAHTVIVNLGHCIKNNAAANIFNKDLDGRNYGVSRLLKVYLFDYDALEPFTEVKIRSNADMEPGEEDVPDWYFEDGYVFLPEEIEAGLQFERRAHSRMFLAEHGDLLTLDYWQDLQDQLLSGKVPGIRVYPESERFIRDVPIAGVDGLQE